VPGATSGFLVAEMGCQLTNTATCINIANPATAPYAGGYTGGAFTFEWWSQASGGVYPDDYVGGFFGLHVSLGRSPSFSEIEPQDWFDTDYSFYELGSGAWGARSSTPPRSRATSSAGTTSSGRGTALALCAGV
jgi:hypothetical protein